jgi:plastocyanin
MGILLYFVFFFAPADPLVATASDDFDVLEFAPPAQFNPEELMACRAGLEAVRQFEAPQPTPPTEPPAATTEDPDAPTATPVPPTATPRPAPTVDRVGFPENYEEDYKLLFVFDRPDNQQVRAICGNSVAADTAPGEPFDYGSFLVMETWATKKDENGVAVLDENGHYIRERLTGLFLQRKEEGFGEAYLDDRSGEWEYVAYRPNGDILTPPQNTNACAACHLQQGGENLDFVFRMNLLYEGEAAQTAPETSENQVAIYNYAFATSPITVEVGTTVTWINLDETNHFVISSDGLFESDVLRSINVVSEPDSFSFTFDEVGTYEYYSSERSAVRGVVEVVENLE